MGVPDYTISGVCSGDKNKKEAFIPFWPCLLGLKRHYIGGYKMPRTSIQSRFEEWKRLDLRASNGRIFSLREIRRWRQLRKEFVKNQAR